MFLGHIVTVSVHSDRAQIRSYKCSVLLLKFNKIEQVEHFWIRGECTCPSAWLQRTEYTWGQGYNHPPNRTAGLTHPRLWIFYLLRISGDIIWWNIQYLLRFVVFNYLFSCFTHAPLFVVLNMINWTELIRLCFMFRIGSDYNGRCCGFEQPC